MIPVARTRRAWSIIQGADLLSVLMIVALLEACATLANLTINRIIPVANKPKETKL